MEKKKKDNKSVHKNKEKKEKKRFVGLNFSFGNPPIHTNPFPELPKDEEE